MRINVFPVGSRVYVTSYGPFRGLRGTVQEANTIASELEEPFCFYLIDLEGGYIQEPIWFEYDEVELIASPLVALQANDELTSRELTAGRAQS